MENDMIGSCILAVLLACLGIPAVANAQPSKDVKDVARGELLYTTHCIACHSAEIHWRDKKIAKDLIGLNTQVRRWQGVAGLKWNDGDIEEVARYLNTLYYHYPERAK
jgi:mono/diheme cytochrome c family protein